MKLLRSFDGSFRMSTYVYNAWVPVIFQHAGYLSYKIYNNMASANFIDAIKLPRGYNGAVFKFFINSLISPLVLVKPTEKRR